MKTTKPAEKDELDAEYGTRFGRQITKILSPYIAWKNGVSFATSRYGWPQRVSTIAHELGHLWHLTPEEYALVDRSSPKGLAEFIQTMSEHRANQNELEARAVNYLVNKTIHISARELEWFGSEAPQGKGKPTDSEIFDQARLPQTQEVAARVWAVLFNAGLI